jgi:hypothetical protein
MCKNYSPERFNGNPTGISHVEERDFRMVNMRKAHYLFITIKRRRIPGTQSTTLSRLLATFAMARLRNILQTHNCIRYSLNPERRFFWGAIYEFGVVHETRASQHSSALVYAGILGVSLSQHPGR